ncbi:MAG TPA: methionyl-tRNA formyltransferase, partial [Chthoniobacteraceae bacterium]|nr:methionyl-tRNA formyltransferase [Chthoniobacteraceae bacterium]
RKMELRPSPIKEAALHHGIEVFQPARIRNPEAVEKLKAFGADIFVVMAYGQILPRTVLEIPPVACLNLHASLLPRHRGAAPIQAAILAGDTETGIAVMHMDEGLDTGDVLLEKHIPIAARETGGSLHDRLAQLAPVALAEALTLLNNGSAPRAPQDSTMATYAAKLTRESGVIDWAAPAAQIDRLVRAMNPWPGASTTIPGKDGQSQALKIFMALPHSATGSPGAVLQTSPQGILVAASDSAILLQEIQLEGKKRMAARDFLAGHSIAPGTVLGASK